MRLNSTNWVRREVSDRTRLPRIIVVDLRLTTTSEVGTEEV